MRRPLKPFTVEIKKSRKGGDESKAPLLMPDLAPFAEPTPPRSEAVATAERLFRREMVPESAGAGGQARPPERILPDLTWEARQPPPAAEPVAVAARAERIRGPRKPQPPKDKPIRLDFATVPKRPVRVEAVAPARALPVETPAAEPGRPRGARRATTAGVAFARGERWKRRLPKALW